MSRCRQLLDLDADPVAIWEALAGRPARRARSSARPGRRVPGAADGFELAVRAVIGQQVSVPGARTVAGPARAGGRRPAARARSATLTHLFPTPAALVELAGRDPGAFAMPAGRRRALVALAEAVESGDVVIDPGADPLELRRSLVRLPGHRAVDGRVRGHARAARPRRVHADRPRHPPGGAGARPARRPGPPRRASTERWRPWRSYAMAHLWSLPAPGRRHSPPHDHERTCSMSTDHHRHRHHAPRHPDRPPRARVRRRRADRRLAAPRAAPRAPRRRRRAPGPQGDGDAARGVLRRRAHRVRRRRWSSTAPPSSGRSGPS